MELSATLVWGILAVALVLVEAATPQLISVWFAAGAIISLLASILSAPIWLQILLFVVVSVFLLLITRPLARKLNKSAEHMNADRIVGMTGKVLVEIDNINSKGLIKVAGQEWSARSSDDSIIPEDTLVEVVKLKGVKAIVKMQKA